MSGWNSQGWNNPYGYSNTGGTGFGRGGFGGPRGPPPQMSGMYNMWGPYGGNQMGMVSRKIRLKVFIHAFSLVVNLYILSHTLIYMKF